MLLRLVQSPLELRINPVFCIFCRYSRLALSVLMTYDSIIKPLCRPAKQRPSSFASSDPFFHTLPEADYTG